MPTRVSEIMTRKMLTIASDAKLEDAAWGFSLKRVQGAPVKDVDGRIVGILSKSDIGILERLHTPAEDLRARDAMARVLYAVAGSDPVNPAPRRFLDTSAQHLVVLDDQDNLVGIL